MKLVDGKCEDHGQVCPLRRSTKPALVGPDGFRAERPLSKIIAASGYDDIGL